MFFVNYRRPYYDEEPEGYLESDDDYIDNNIVVVRRFLDFMEIKTEPVSDPYQKFLLETETRSAINSLIYRVKRGNGEITEDSIMTELVDQVLLYQEKRHANFSEELK